MNTRYTILAVVLLAGLSFSTPAAAAINVNVNAGAAADNGSASTSVKGSVRTGSAQRVSTMQSRGDREIDARVESLNKLSARIQEMKNVSASEKASISATIQSEIGALGTLKARIDAGTSTTTVRGDVQSIAPAYRIYALIMPQLHIIAASDRIITLVGMMNTLGIKLQSRLSASATVDASLQAKLTDFNAKTADAGVQAQAAVSLVAGLRPDQGNQTIMQSNLAALKDARSKIRTAEQDLKTARKDAQDIIKELVKSDRALMHMDASATTSASTTVH